MELRVGNRIMMIWLALAAIAVLMATWVGRAESALPAGDACTLNGTSAMLGFEGGDANFTPSGTANCYDWTSAEVKPNVTTVEDVTTIFGVGTKDDDDPVDVMQGNIVNGDPNAKTDIIRAHYFASYPLFAVGLIRGDGNGTSAYSLEFNQAAAVGSNLPARSAGDKLFIFDFQANGQAVVKEYSWITSGVCAGAGNPPCWHFDADVTGSLAVGKSNLGPIADNPLTTAVDPVATRTFDELAIDAQGLLLGDVPAGSCKSFGSVWIRSRLGGSFNSNLSDVLKPEPIHVSNCDVNITKSVTSPITTPVAFGATVTYQVAVTLADGSSPIAKGKLTVRDTSTTDPALNNTTLNYMSGDSNGNELLDTGETWLYGTTASTPVTQAADNCPIHNTASVAIADTDISHTTSDVVTQVACPPDMAITKTASPAGDVRPGDLITYTITVTRTDQFSDVGMDVGSVTDSLSATPLVRMSGDTNNDGKLNVGESWQYGASASAPFTTTVPQSCAQVVNTATVTPATGQADTDSQNNSSTVTNDIVCFPDVEIVKTAQPTTVQPGGVIAYSIGVRRIDGDPIAIPVGTVTDIMPNGTLVTLAPLTDAQGNIVGDTDRDGLLDPKPASGAGEMWMYGLNGAPVTVTAPIDSCADIVNNATVTMAPGNDATLANNSDSAVVTVDCRPDLGITKVADKATYTVGETIHYTVTVTNTGNLAVPFAEITVSDPKVALTLQGTAPTLLLPGAKLIYTGALVTTAANVGQVPNVATVSTPNDSNTSNNRDDVTVTVVAPPAVVVQVASVPQTTLAIDKTAPLNAKLGTQIVYTITVRNSGPNPALDVVVSDAIPPGLTAVRRPSGSTITRGVITWNVGTLQAGESRTFKVPMKAGGTKSVRRCNVASADGSNTERVSDGACTRFAKVAGVKKPPVVTG